MTLLDVIAKTAGSTSSKRRALEREAARLAAEFADTGRWRHGLSLQARDRQVEVGGTRDADLDRQLGDVRQAARETADAIANCDRALARLDDQVRADDLIAKRALRDRKDQKRNVYWNFVANLESCLLKS